MNHPFTVRKLTLEEGDGYLAETLDLPGCMADGVTAEEAVHELEDAVESWIRTHEDLGISIPEASCGSDIYSVIHTPRALYQTLSELSKQEGVSLNAFAVSLLSQGVTAYKYDA